MRIIHIFPGKIWGGAEQYILDLGNALSEKKHDVTFLTFNTPAIKRRLQGKVPYQTLPSTCTWDIYSIFRLSAIIKENRAEVLHIHDMRFVPLAIGAKALSHSSVKVILTRHIARESHTFPFFRNAYKQLHRIVFVSQLAKNMWMKANPWMPDEKIQVLHNSIPPQSITTGKDELRVKYHIHETTPLIVFTGRVRRSKGCAILIQALGMIRDLPFALVFIGSCKPKNYADRLLLLAQKNGIKDKVFFHGFSNNVRALIQDADLGIAPSIVREACPLSPMEFMQAGICVIATNNGAQPEYIFSGKNGLLVSPNHPKELAEAIKRVLEQPDYRKKLGENAKQYFDTHLSYSQFIGQICTLYGIEFV